jgi:hypothetical protein
MRIYTLCASGALTMQRRLRELGDVECNGTLRRVEQVSDRPAARLVFAVLLIASALLAAIVFNGASVDLDQRRRSGRPKARFDLDQFTQEIKTPTPLLSGALLLGNQLLSRRHRPDRAAPHPPTPRRSAEEA